MIDVIYLLLVEVVVCVYVDKEKYDVMYVVFVVDLEVFWGEEGKCLDWIILYIKVKNILFVFGDVLIKWFEDGELNVVVNCIDCYLEMCGD